MLAVYDNLLDEWSKAILAGASLLVLCNISAYLRQIRELLKEKVCGSKECERQLKEHLAKLWHIPDGLKQLMEERAVAEGKPKPKWPELP